MGGKASRDKGKRGERSFAADLRRVLPEFADRIRRGWQSREGSDEPDITGVPGYWFESKCEKRPRPIAALTQAKEAAAKAMLKAIPVAVIKQDRKDPVVVMFWEDFLVLLRKGFDYDRQR